MSDSAQTTDTLTGLPGRDSLLQRLRSLTPTTPAALICIDLEQLSALNETLGLSAGDVLLMEAARRIASYADGSDFLARYGGDEFGLLLAGRAQARQAEQVTAALINTLRSPYLIAGREVFLGASIGVAYNTLGGTTDGASEVHGLHYPLLQHAEAALSRVKQTARGSWLAYQPGMAREMGERLTLETELYRAMEQQQFLVYYQPKVSCHSGKISGFEALLRWRHPRKGIVPPSEFVPTLEDTGLIEGVGAWVLGTACQQLMIWDSQGFEGLRMSVNVSLRQLNDPAFPEIVAAVLADLNMPGDQLELELTESMLMRDVVRTESLLLRLKALGVQLSIDDFGTGYSSLAYLKRLPIDTVKIDRAFVQDITTDPNDASITRAIIGMAHSLKMTVVAEGVETEAQLSTLISQHCDTVQGYYVSRPIAAADAQAMLSGSWSLSTSVLRRPAKTRTLLLVDDEESIVLALKRLLRREGYRILSASSAAKGLELLAMNDVDVIVSDQRMPHMTGEEFLRRVKDLYPETMRLMLSGYADMESITKAINQGAVYKFMLKPWDEQGLKDGIAEAFRHKEIREENLRLTQEMVSKNQELSSSNQTLVDLLDDQARTSTIGLTALDVSQETLFLLPVPVIGFDPDGMVTVRNAAYIDLNCPAEVEDLLAEMQSSWSDDASRVLSSLRIHGDDWSVAARHLFREGTRRGTIFVLYSRDTGHG